MTSIKTPIIPQQQTFATVNAPHELHLEAICVFSAIGFFLDKDTYWKDSVVLPAASINTIHKEGVLEASTPWFDWHYTPREISFEQALDEFSLLLESIIKEQTQGKKVILPLSGGLDSRTQAVALRHIKADVFSYSYQFEHGYRETKIAKQIADVCDFEFKAFTIPNGYLWDCIDDLARLNGCYSDFTAPRQMAIYDAYEGMGDVFSLGHWGDVLFDSMNLPSLSLNEEVDVVFNKLIKRGGLQLATDLWQTWQLDGDFASYFKQRLLTLLQGISIEDTNAKIRAFKSMYWAPRWTSVNLSVFESVKPIALPYYDDRMCAFICTIPEAYLKNRQLQIAYIQRRSPGLARITWQDQRPFNLNTFGSNKAPFNLPYKVVNKLQREFRGLTGQSYVQRNWELQFLGGANKAAVKRHLLDHGLPSWIPSSLISRYYTQFYNHDPLQHAHAINMLLVFSKFNQLYIHE